MDEDVLVDGVSDGEGFVGGGIGEELFVNEFFDNDGFDNEFLDLDIEILGDGFIDGDELGDMFGDGVVILFFVEFFI